MPGTTGTTGTGMGATRTTDTGMGSTGAMRVDPDTGMPAQDICAGNTRDGRRHCRRPSDRSW
jgi:hypothetical protein